MFNQHNMMFSFPITESQQLQEFVQKYSVQYRNQNYLAGSMFIRCAGYEAMKLLYFQELFKVKQIL